MVACWQEIAAMGAGESVGEKVQWTLEAYLPRNGSWLNVENLPGNESWLNVVNERCTKRQHGVVQPFLCMR